MARIGVVVQKWGEHLSGAERAIYTLISNINNNNEIIVYSSDISKFSPMKNVDVKLFKFTPVELLSSDKTIARIFNKIANFTYPGIKEEVLFFKHFSFSDELIKELERDVEKLDLILVTPYLFGAGLFVSIYFGHKTVMIPCYHDEFYAQLKFVNLAFQSVKGFICYSEPEKEQLKQIVGNKSFKVVGIPVESIEVTKKEVQPYLLYLGRRELAKGIVEAIDFVRSYNLVTGDNLKIKLVGSGSLPIPVLKSYAEVDDIGPVTEDEKKQLICNALALVQPSKNESFSLVIMEAMAAGTPVIVNSNCLVTDYFVKKSQAGFSVSSFEDFCVAVQLLKNDRTLRVKLGENGRTFVSENFNKDIVLGRFEEALLFYLRKN